jgi:hypothetical protein
MRRRSFRDAMASVGTYLRRPAIPDLGGVEDASPMDGGLPAGDGGPVAGARPDRYVVFADEAGEVFGESGVSMPAPMTLMVVADHSAAMPCSPQTRAPWG